MNFLLILVQEKTDNIYLVECDLLERTLESFESQVGRYSEDKSYLVRMKRTGEAKPLRDYLHSVFHDHLSYSAGSNLNWSRWLPASCYDRLKSLVEYLAEFSSYKVTKVSWFKQEAHHSHSRVKQELNGLESREAEFEKMAKIKEDFTAAVRLNGEYLWKRVIDGKLATLEFTNLTGGTEKILDDLQGYRLLGFRPFSVTREGNGFSLSIDMDFYSELKTRRNLAVLRSWFDEIYQFKRKSFDVSGALIWAGYKLSERSNRSIW